MEETGARIGKKTIKNTQKGRKPRKVILQPLRYSREGKQAYEHKLQKGVGFVVYFNSSPP